jgi:hypothetical protein
MEIPDTVVEGHQGVTEGSHEYLVFEKVLLAQAKKYGLHPVSGGTRAALAGCCRTHARTHASTTRGRGLTRRPLLLPHTHARAWHTGDGLW